MRESENRTFAGMVVRFFWNTLARFAKTVGCICLIAGFAVGGWFYEQQAPMMEAARYRESSLLTERLSRLADLYRTSQASVIAFKGTAELPCRAKRFRFQSGCYAPRGDR